MNKSIYTGNEKQNGHHVQHIPLVYQNYAHNHRYHPFSEGNNIISIDELTELNVNSPVNVDCNNAMLNSHSNSYRGSHYHPKMLYNRQFSSYQSPNFLYTDNFHSIDAPPIMSEDSKAFHSMSMPTTVNDYCLSRNYSVDSFGSFYDSSFLGYSVYKKKDPHMSFSEEPFTSLSIFDNKQLLEKHRKRRESHNAVERRRRDNINEKIQELATLVSESLFKDKIGSNSDVKNLNHSDCKLNKGEILRKSVDYIRSLQNYINELNTRSQWLENEVVRLGGDLSVINKTELSPDISLNINDTLKSNYSDNNSIDFEVKKDILMN
ncbi:uncharacterized protein T551_03099 [Pneumocystis jirovecii RU7]|uniref:BHLH domain-containing protein n=1 Tax=Pneumocystis jirovecii (strain RU7) TaxID=1408657 RepID=A0A0W4ZGV1_PNEJ7|nr:uncharacterized protein T551_03099 [Pneumocystis jirovecii RU7]KTW27600.1 hypothetical protein T551_03099 [Pneumocystis jirovecii RU7]